MREMSPFLAFFIPVYCILVDSFVIGPLPA